MLQKIHEKVQGVIAWVLVTLITITFILWGINYYIDSHHNNSVNTVAEVNGVIIDQNNFHNNLERAKRSEQGRLGDKFNYTVAFEQQLKQQTLKTLILQQVLEQAAQKAGFLVNLQQAELMMSQIPQFQERGVFSETKFEQVIREALFTPASFIQQVQQGMLLNQQHFAFVGSSFALPSDTDLFIKLLNQTRDYSYLEIDANKFKDQVSVSDQELQQFYQKNKEHYKTDEQLSIQYLELSLNDLIATIKVSNEEVQAYYRDNSANYIKPAQWQLAHILIKLPNNATPAQIDTASQRAHSIVTQLQKGSKFTTLVQQYSDDIVSAKKEGLMPVVTPGILSPEVDTAMMQLKKPGDFSNPIKTKYGYEIISLVSYQPPQTIPFEQVKDQIIHMIKNDQAQKLFAQKSEQLADSTFQNPDSLQAAATELQLPIKHSDLFTKLGLPKGIVHNKKVVTAAYSDDVLIQKNNSQVIQVDDNTVVVLRINQHLLPQIISYDKMKDNIKQMILTQKQQQLAAEYGNKLVQQLHLNKSVTEMFAALKLEWRNQKNIKRTLNQNTDPIAQLAFSLPRPQKNTSLAVATKIIDGNFVIVRLEKVTDGNISQVTKDQRKAYAHEIESAFGAMEYSLYQQGLMKRAKVVTHM